MEEAKILIVEDEIIIAMELESNLVRFGYAVTSIADSGETAISRVESEKPDLVLMDIRVKGKMDGIQAAEIIRVKFGIPVVFSTAYLDQERIERAKITMPFGYVLKPIQERELRVTIQMALYTSKVENERKQLQAELKAEKERYKMLYERAPLGYQSLDEKGCFIDVNNAWLNSLGYSKEEVIGKSFSDFIHPEWADHFKENFPRFKTMGEILGVEFNMVRKDGSLVLISFNGKIGYDADGRFKQTHCILKDITHERSVEEKLRESEKKYSLAFHTSPDAVNINRMDGLYVDINEGFARLTGYTREDVIGKFSSEIHIWAIPEDREKLVHALKTKGYINNLESKFRCKDGSFKISLMSASLIELNNEPHILSITRDISDRKKMEDDLRESQLVFSQQFYQSSTSMGLYSPDGTIEKANPKFCEMFEVEEQEIISRRYNLFEDPAIEECGSIPFLKKLYSENEPGSWQVKYNTSLASLSAGNAASDKSILKLEIYGYPILDQDGEILHMVLQYYFMR